VLSGLHLVAVALTFIGLFVGLFATICAVCLVWDFAKNGGALRHPKRWVLLGGLGGGAVLAVVLLIWAGVLRQAAGPLPRLPDDPRRAEAAPSR
jgi:hypothetical protein